MRASRASHGIEYDARVTLALAEDRLFDDMTALLHEYHTALSTMDGATQRTA